MISNKSEGGKFTLERGAVIRTKSMSFDAKDFATGFFQINLLPSVCIPGHAKTHRLTLFKKFTQEKTRRNIKNFS